MHDFVHLKFYQSNLKQVFLVHSIEILRIDDFFFQTEILHLN
jgi:hypothetical protein